MNETATMLIDGNTLMRGARPKSFRDVSHDVTAIINLQSGAYEAATNTGYEFEFAEDFGLTEYNIPMSDFTPPKRWQIDIVLKIIARHKGTYIHCLHGKDRTGFVWAAIRMMKFGWSFEMALVELYKFGFHRFPYAFWLYELEKYEVKK